MEIDTIKLKQSLEKQKFPERENDPTGVVERVFNRGIKTAIEIIEIYEKMEVSDGNP